VTLVLDTEELLGTRPADTTISREGLLALRTRSRRPEERLAQRVSAELKEILDEDLRYQFSTYWELVNEAVPVAPSKALTSAGRQVIERAHAPSRAPTSAERALAALSTVMAYLQISETAAASVVGVSRNTIRGWREGREPYPATTRRLFQVTNLLQAIERAVSNVPQWLDEPTQSGVLRRDLLREEDGAASLAREATELLFGGTYVRTLAQELPAPSEAEDADELSASAPRFEFVARPRRGKAN
jgi:hypothetical protein